MTTFHVDNDNVVSEEEDIDNDDNDKEDVVLDIQLIAKNLATDWQIGEWVAVTYYENWYPGIIQRVSYS